MLEFINVSASAGGLDEKTRRKARSDAMRAFRRQQRQQQEAQQQRESETGQQILTPPSSNSSISPRSHTSTPPSAAIDSIPLTTSGSSMASTKSRGPRASISSRTGKALATATKDPAEQKKQLLLSWAKKHGLDMNPVSRRPNKLGVMYNDAGEDITKIAHWYFYTAIVKPAGLVSNSVTHHVLNEMWSAAQREPVLMDIVIPTAMLMKARITGNRELDKSYYAGKGRMIRGVQDKISTHGLQVDSTVLVITVSLAWLEIMTGDLTSSAVHYQGIRQLARHIRIPPEFWSLVAWPIARISMVLGAEPVTISCTDPTALTINPETAIPKDILSARDSSAHANALLYPNCASSSRMGFEDIHTMFRHLHRFCAVRADAKLRDDPRVYGGQLYYTEAQLAMVRHHLMGVEVEKRDKGQRAVELLLIVCELLITMLAGTPACARLVGRGIDLLAEEGQGWIDFWEGAVGGDVKGLLWVGVVVMAFDDDDHRVPESLAGLFERLLARCELDEFEPFLVKVNEWPWFVEEFSKVRSLRIWAKIQFAIRDSGKNG